MVEVVRNTAQLSAADRDAMAVYLKSLPAAEIVGCRIESAWISTYRTASAVCRAGNATP